MTQDHVEVLEYREDINYYFKGGHGNEINSQLACTTVVDMLYHLETENATSPKVIAYFAHASTIQLLLTALGAAKDTIPLKSDNFAEMTNRKWKTSEICPFASNLAAVKYQCPNDEESPQRVKFFLNQKPLEFGWCNNGLCKLSDVVDTYRLYKEVDCERYFCSGGQKLFFRVFAVLVNLMLIYLF